MSATAAGGAPSANGVPTTAAAGSTGRPALPRATAATAHDNGDSTGTPRPPSPNNCTSEDATEVKSNAPAARGDTAAGDGGVAITGATPAPAPEDTPADADLDTTPTTAEDNSPTDALGAANATGAADLTGATPTARGSTSAVRSATGDSTTGAGPLRNGETAEGPDSATAAAAAVSDPDATTGTSGPGTDAAGR